jgi:MerR family transcriptional regulator, light-induced transcriptional regulator
MNQRTPPIPISVSIAAVERDTGIGKDTLRIWERRYGFPTPDRDAFGERSYPLDQVEKLRVIKRLLDQGHRPGRLVALPMDTLLRISQGQASAPQQFNPESDRHTDLRDFMDCVAQHDVEGLRRRLNQAVVSLGLYRFVIDLVAPLTVLVGEAWMRGELEIFEEHIYTECITSVMRQTIGNLPHAQQQSRPIILLTTFPQESHSLGLLMVECLLALEGCLCLSLGTQTPLPDIVKAVAAHRVDIVALSFSLSVNANQVNDGLQELRQLLPQSVEIWAGGRNPALRRRGMQGVMVLGALDQIPGQVRDWRQLHRA